MTILRTVALRALLAVLVAGLAGGCLPIGFRGSSLYVPAAVAPAGT
jgi:hypothetical protein